MKNFASALVFLLLASACQNNSENTLATDLNSNVKCPANGCANHAADANELTIDGPLGTLISYSTDNTVQVGGNCYASTYMDNRIEVTVTNASRQPVLAQFQSLESATPKCVLGRYNLVVDGRALPVGALYRVRVELVGFDGGGAAFRGGQNWTEFTVNRTQ